MPAAYAHAYSRCYYSCMARAPLYEWHGKEYSSGEKGGDWFWALAIIAAAAIIACILFNQIILGLVVLAASVTVALQAAKRPRVHRFSITEEGVEVDNNLYPYKSILHFSVLEYLDPSLPPALSLKTKSIMAPHLLIPIIGHDAEEIYEYVSFHVKEGSHDESPIDRLIELMRL